MPRSSQWSLFCRYPYQNSLLPHTCYMPCYSPYPPGCKHLNSIWWCVPVMKCLIIQFGEQCKSWSALYNLVSSANHEVPHHTIWWACISWSSYHTIWWAWKSLSSLHSIWWAVQIMKCLIIVCFSLLLFPLSLPKYLPQHHSNTIAHL
jgi:hypothetical protein